MNVKYALATAGLLLLGAASAQALPLTIGPITPAGPDTSFSTTITNTTGSDIDIFGDSILDLSSNSNTVDTDDIGDNLPVTVPGGGSIPWNFSFSSATTASNISLALKDVNDTVIGVGGGPNVPEPGSVALLVGMTMSGGLFLARRRRK
jgi:hypothetical protein